MVDKVPFRLSFGNTYSEAEENNQQIENEINNSNKFTLFVALNDDEAKTSEYIKKVSYNLNSADQKVSMTKAPFALTKFVNSTKMVDIEIEF